MNYSVRVSTSNEFHLELVLLITADVRIANKVYFVVDLGLISIFFFDNKVKFDLCLSNSFEISDLFDCQKFVQFGSSNNYPPLLILVSRVELSLNWLSETLQFFIIFNIWSTNIYCQFGSIPVLVLRLIKLELHLNCWVSIADFSNLRHLLLGDTSHYLCSQFLIHVHEIDDILHLGFL
jgi:hypothetical protein